MCVSSSYFLSLGLFQGLSHKDKDKDKDQTHKDKEQYLKFILKDSLRTKINITGYSRMREHRLFAP